MKKIPKFISVPAPTKLPPNGVLSNWVIVHDYITSLPVSRNSLATICHLMRQEYLRKPGPRMDIVVRLYGKLNGMRKEIERAEL